MRKIWYTINLSFHIVNLPHQKRKLKAVMEWEDMDLGSQYCPIVGGKNVSERNYYSEREPSPRNRRSNSEYHEDGVQRRPKKRKRKSKVKLFFQIIGTLLLIGITTSAMLACFAAVYIKSVILPEADMDLGNFSLNENSVMYYQDQNGNYQELGKVLSVTKSQWVDFDEIPQDLKDAAVAIEDRRFYSHDGVDWWRTAQAVFSMFTGGDIQGGSTITQQLIKNLTDYNETTVKRKVTEIFRALKLDANYDKDVILERYLNIIPLGSGCEGVGAASYEYFGKHVSELTLAECASLIAITNNPSKYGPYSIAKVENSEGEMWSAKEWNKYRQELILGQMLKQEMITQSEYDEAVVQELIFEKAEGETNSTDLYSWYEEQVITDVIHDLQEQKGYSDSAASQLLSNGGLQIYTCIDPEVQAKAEEIYEDRSNLDFSSNGQELQSAITIIDNQTGDIAAIVGRVGAKEGNRWKNLATDALRQPGSSIKPLTVYAPAIEMGLITPISVISDYPHEVLNGKAWPVNVDGRYRGQVTVKEAVRESYNTVAVSVVADLVTPAKAFEFGTQKFHLPLESGKEVNGQVVSDVNVAPLSMGGLTDGVTTRDMAQAFATFPNNGVYREARTYTVVKDSDGNIVLDNSREDETVLKATTAYYMNSLLQNVAQNGGARNEVRISNMTVAGKTGTTDSKYDRWFVGYTPYYTAAVWVGYEYNQRVNTPGMYNPASNLWGKVMRPIHEGLENQSFSKPGGLEQVYYCMDCGGRAIEACQHDPRGSRVASDYVFAEDAPTEVCTCHSLEAGSGSLIRVCVDDPIWSEDGSFTGAYHQAGPYCPEVSVRNWCYLNLDRDSIGGVVAEDNAYLYQSVAGIGTCTVHTTDPTVPEEPEEPEQPDTSTEPEEPTEPEESEGGSQDIQPPDGGSQDINAQPDDPGNSSQEEVTLNPETGRPYGY